MPTIGVPIDDIPDELPQVSVGLHTARIVDVKEDSDKNGKTYIGAEFEIDEGSEEDGRKLWTRFYLEHAPAQVNWRKFCRAAGVESGAPSTEDLIGAHVKVRVEPNAYQTASGETRENTQIAEFLVEA